ncbi:hypothetical protein CLO54_21375 [Salmonella enterica]|nr:hypothetical protein [Salmonella enterica]
MRGVVGHWHKLSPLFLAIMVAVGNNSPAYARSGIPAGFEALSLGQNELLNVSFHGENEGVFTVFVTPEYLTFKDPNALFEKLPLDGVSEDIRKKILQGLSLPITRHDESFHLAPGKKIGVIYNEQEQSVMLLITPEWIKNNNQHFFHPNHDAHPAFVSHQSLVFSHDGRMESLGGSGHFAQGVGNSSYIQGEWGLFQNAGENVPSSSRFQLNNLYLRSDITPGLYSQIGRMDMTNLNSRLGGDFSLSLLPLSQIDGLRIGSTNAYINTEDISTTSTPLSVVLTQSARVDIYQGKQLLGSSYLGPGIHDIDTNNFPAGAYPVLMKIFQNGKLVRQETQFFENSGQDQPKLGKSQWFFQIGKKRTLSNYDGMMYSSKRNKNETQFSGGVRVGLSSRLSLTSALMGQGTAPIFSENALMWSLPTQAGVLSLKSSYMMKATKGIADSEQLSWNYNNHTLSLLRYHSFCQNQLGCSNNYSVTASTSRYGWTASLGYNYSHSTQRFLQPLEYEEEYATSYAKQSVYQQNRELSSHSLQYVTSSMLLTLGTSANYQGWNIWPRMGIFSNRSSGGNHQDNGVFLTISLSKNIPSTSSFSHNTTASLDYRQHSQNTVSLGQQWVWNEQDYRSLAATLSGGKRYQNALASAEWDGALGNLGVSFGYDRSQQYTNKAINGHYDSTFAISSAGMMWGNGGGNESTLSGIIIDAKNDSGKDIKGPIAKISSMQGDNVYLNDGHQTFIPVMDYMADKVNIEDVSGHGANGNLIHGAGTHNIFLLPGHVSVTRLRADVVYIYVGRLLVNGENRLAGGHILNADVPDINSDGSFVAEFNYSPDSLFVLKDREFFVCPVKYRAGFNGVRRMENSNCHLISNSDLPEIMRKSERVAKLVSMAIPKRQGN